MSARPALLAAIAALACSLAACGGGSDDAPPPPGHEGVAVIEGWADKLTDGDVRGAADYFAVPSIAENGSGPLTLRSRADVVAFNRALPCGAKLVRARPLDRFIAATFRLTERPGGSCGPGAGQIASTAFVIKDGKIAQWRRLPGPPGGEGGGSGGGGPIV